MAMAFTTMTLQQLSLFAQVYEMGSFNRAAHAAYLSQAAVSQHMQRLEQVLGTALFTRSSRGVVPTAAGETLYAYTTQILSLAADAEQAVMHVSEAEGLSLQIGATPGISVYLLPEWLKHFQTDYPKVSLSLKSDVTKTLLSDVQNGRLSLAFFVGDVSDLDTNGLQQRWLQDVTYSVVMNPAHPWVEAAVIEPEWLSNASFLTRQPDSRSRAWLDGELAKLGVMVQPSAEMDNPGVIKYALLSGLGVSILPEYAVAREVARGELVQKKLGDVVLKRPLFLAWNGKRPFGPVERAFLRSLDVDFASGI